jgi:hypothetical protein
MKHSEALMKALELLGPNGENWTKGDIARDASGEVTQTTDEAVCYCGLGALLLVTQGHIKRFMHDSSAENVANWRKLTRHLSKQIPDGSDDFVYAEWQDDPARTFPEVREVFQKAIAEATALEQAA